MLSYTRLLDYAVIAIMAAIWAIMPNDGIAVVTQWFYNKVMDVSFHLIRLSSGPYFSYFSLLFWFAPAFPYFFLKMPFPTFHSKMSFMHKNP